jgi:hypothetical protein
MSVSLEFCTKSCKVRPEVQARRAVGLRDGVRSGGEQQVASVPRACIRSGRIIIIIIIQILAISWLINLDWKWAE